MAESTINGHCLRFTVPFRSPFSGLKVVGEE